MEIVYVIATIFVVYWLYKGYKWIKFKNKYPILSVDPPSGILEKGDYVSFGKEKVRYLGINNSDNFGYIFEKEDSVNNTILTKSELTKRLDAVYGKYGLKWKKIK